MSERLSTAPAALHRATLIESVFFVAMLATVLSCGAALAHAYALPNKIGMSREAYFIAQQAYNGWAILGIPVVLAIAAAVVLAALTWRTRPVRPWTTGAALCLVAAHVLFWLVTQPANVATSNWKVQPETWESLRRQWEYSHAVGAALQIAAMAALVLGLTAYGRLHRPSR